MIKKLLAVLIVCGAMPVHATLFKYSATFSGPAESPPNGSPGTGFGTVNYDDVAHSLIAQVSFSSLLGTTTASHIHAATTDPFTLTAGVATTTPSFAGFPLGVTSGSFANTLDLTLTSSWNPSFITAHGGTPLGAETFLATAMAEGKAYWNIHSSAVPGGEIRGFLVAVPEPSSLALVGLGAVGLAARAWSKRRASKA